MPRNSKGPRENRKRVTISLIVSGSENRPMHQGTYSWECAQEMLATGMYIRHRDEFGRLQNTMEAVEFPGVEKPLTIDPSVITPGEMSTIAGTAFRKGKSRTMALSEEAKLEMEAAGKPKREITDFIEAAVSKLYAYTHPTIQDGKNVRVYPRGSVLPKFQPA
jgi:hypothetical protein